MSFLLSILNIYSLHLVCAKHFSLYSFLLYTIYFFFFHCVYLPLIKLQFAYWTHCRHTHSQIYVIYVCVSVFCSFQHSYCKFSYLPVGFLPLQIFLLPCTSFYFAFIFAYRYSITCCLWMSFRTCDLCDFVANGLELEWFVLSHSIILLFKIFIFCFF